MLKMIQALIIASRFDNLKLCYLTIILPFCYLTIRGTLYLRSEFSIHFRRLSGKFLRHTSQCLAISKEERTTRSSLLFGIKDNW